MACLPSGEKATLQTTSSWPKRTRTSSLGRFLSSPEATEEGARATAGATAAASKQALTAAGSQNERLSCGTDIGLLRYQGGIGRGVSIMAGNGENARGYPPARAGRSQVQQTGWRRCILISNRF